MQDLIAHLEARQSLDAGQIHRAVAGLLSAQVSEDSKALFLQTLRHKGETAPEIAGFATELLRHAVDPGLDPLQVPGPMLDVCGTGGDRMELFNISTTSMFVLAAGGVAVVKHGNRAITSQCGGADVLEALGVKIDMDPPTLRRCVYGLGLGFVFAPAYHPTFKAIAPVRKLLAARRIPTIFNMLGPLLNPAQPAFQMVGIFSHSLLETYAKALAQMGRTRAWALHGDGTDELSTTRPSHVWEVGSGGALRSFVLDPALLGLAPAHFEALRGGDRSFNAGILLGILDGSLRGAPRDIVLLNAAAGFVITGLVPDLASGIAYASEQLDSGRALAKLRGLQTFTA